MKILLTFFVLFFSSAVFSIEWDFETLNPVFEGCLDDSNNGTDYEYALLMEIEGSSYAWGGGPYVFDI